MRVSLRAYVSPPSWKIDIIMFILYLGVGHSIFFKFYTGAPRFYSPLSSILLPHTSKDQYLVRTYLPPQSTQILLLLFNFLLRKIHKFF